MTSTPAPLPALDEVSYPGRIIFRTGLSAQIKTSYLRLGEGSLTTDNWYGWLGDESQNPPHWPTSKSTGLFDWTNLTPIFDNIIVNTINGTSLADLDAFKTVLGRLRIVTDYIKIAGSGFWTTPKNVIGNFGVEIWAGGGGGAGGTGSGGGAGEWAYGVFNSVADTQVPYIVGIGGTGVNSGNATNGGTTSIFGMTANPGTGGGAGFINVGRGGNGGVGGIDRRAGGAGADLDSLEYYACGGTAAHMPSSHYANIADACAGEGGTGSSAGSDIGAFGSNGKAGQIKFTYLVLANP